MNLKIELAARFIEAAIRNEGLPSNENLQRSLVLRACDVAQELIDETDE